MVDTIATYLYGVLCGIALRWFLWCWFGTNEKEGK
jgi:hypothetical protein